MRTDIYPMILEHKVKAGEDLGFVDLQVLKTYYPALAPIADRLEDLQHASEDLEEQYQAQIEGLTSTLTDAFGQVERLSTTFLELINLFQEGGDDTETIVAKLKQLNSEISEVKRTLET